MSAMYEQLRADAAQAIKDFGRPITFKRRSISTTTAEIVAGKPGITVAQTEVLPGVVLPASGGTLEAFDVRFMSDVPAGTDVRFVVCGALTTDGDPAPFQPGPNDVAEMDGRTWQVMGCTPLNVDGTPVIFSIGLKGP